MRCFVSFVSVLSVLAIVSAAPFLHSGGFSASTSLQVGASSPSSSTTAGGGANGLSNILSNIDLPGLLRGVNSFVKLVGAFCPPLSQVLDNVIQNVTSTAFRVFGRAILRNGGLGGGSNGGDSGQRVNVVLPTFPPDEDYEEEEEDSQTENSQQSIQSRTGLGSESATASDDVDTAATGTVTSITSGTVAPETTAPSDVGTTIAETTVSPAIEENIVAKRHVRVTREANDQDGAESAPQPAEDLSNINIDDQDRNKRFLPFGGSVDGHAAGGSGNFLFDIIRNTADRAARTVGTVYRMVAGTENLGWGLSATSETSQTLNTQSTSANSPAKLVAGSGATEETDEKANAPGGVAEVDIAKGADGYTEGIPGPITRLFVIANRGIANLVQDLILRLAQTSERLVNFKARLVTSLI